MSQSFDVVICGAGSIGIAAAYYLAKQKGITKVLLVDKHPPLSQTSAKSGENYRNWWPQKVMVEFTNRSIELMDELADDSDNVFNMSRRGYAYVSQRADRARIEATIEQYRQLDVGAIRLHRGDGRDGAPYTFSPSQRFDQQPKGADILLDQHLIGNTFPHFTATVQSVIHARHCGAISAQQLGIYLLQEAKKLGVQERRAEVIGVEQDNEGVTSVLLHSAAGQETITTRTFINAAGPFAPHIAAMLALELPVFSILQQKIAFQDTLAVIPRDAPFTIFTDPQYLDWSAEEKEFLQSEATYAWLLEQFPGGLHIKPEGGKHSNWIKLGWAFNQSISAPVWEPSFTPEYLDIVLRGASRLVPDLKQYFDHIPSPLSHYGGYYTKTKENLPLIGPLAVKGAYIVGAFAGFGTMTSCAAGELIATWVAGDSLPTYASALSPARYDDPAYVAQLTQIEEDGEL